MHAPDRVEFGECHAAACHIVKALKSCGWKDVLGSAPAHPFTTARLSNVGITLSAVFGQYHDVSLIRGGSGIEIVVPNQGFISSRITKPQKDALIRVIYGVLVHECTHVIQKDLAPQAYHATHDLNQKFHAIPDKDKTVGDWLDLYIGQPFE